MDRDRKLRAITIYLDERLPVVSYHEKKYIHYEEISDARMIRAINSIGAPEDNETCVFLEGQTEIHRYIDVYTLFRLASFTPMYNNAPKTWRHLNDVITNGNAILELTFKELMDIQKEVLDLL